MGRGCGSGSNGASPGRAHVGARCRRNPLWPPVLPPPGERITRPPPKRVIRRRRSGPGDACRRRPVTWPAPRSNRRKRRAAQRASVRRRGGRVPGGVLRASRRPAVVFTRPPRIQRFARDAVRRRRSKDLSTNRHEQHEQASATPRPFRSRPRTRGPRCFSGAGTGLKGVGVPVPHSVTHATTGDRVFFKGAANPREGTRTGSGGGAVGDGRLRRRRLSRVSCGESVRVPSFCIQFPRVPTLFNMIY
jgi:hypothetical protein